MTMDASKKPKYPVVDANPSFSKVIGNFNARDYLGLTTITGMGVTSSVGIELCDKISKKREPKTIIMLCSLSCTGFLGLLNPIYKMSADELKGFHPPPVSGDKISKKPEPKTIVMLCSLSCTGFLCLLNPIYKMSADELKGFHPPRCEVAPKFKTDNVMVLDSDRESPDQLEGSFPNKKKVDQYKK